jgi:hypothetical protein
MPGMGIRSGCLLDRIRIGAAEPGVGRLRNTARGAALGRYAELGAIPEAVLLLTTGGPCVAPERQKPLRLPKLLGRGVRGFPSSWEAAR